MTYPKSVESHLRLYPTAYATEKGLEYINQSGVSEILVSFRGLDEAHPNLIKVGDIVAHDLVLRTQVEPEGLAHDLVARVTDKVDPVTLIARVEDRSEPVPVVEVAQDEENPAEAAVEAPKRGRKPKAESAPTEDKKEEQAE